MRIECQADSTKLSFSNIDAQTDIQKIITINNLNKGFVLHETITPTLQFATMIGMTYIIKYAKSEKEIIRITNTIVTNYIQ